MPRSKKHPNLPPDPDAGKTTLELIAENGVVAQFEVQAIFGSGLPGQVAVPNPLPHTWVILPIKVNCLPLSISYQVAVIRYQPEA